MSKKIRKAGIHIIGDISWGTHFCQFYKTKKDLIDILVPYFKAGLENNEYCMWVTSKPLTEKDAAKALAKALPDLDSYLKRGQIEIIPHDTWYLKNGIFNSKRVNKGWLRKLDKALAKGYDGLRLTNNTFWLKKKDWNSFTDYEKEVDSVIGEYNIIGLCTYSLDKCGTNEVIDVVRNHQFVLIKREGKWEIIESSERKRAEDEIKRFASFPQLSPNPVLEVNSSGIIVFSNAAAVLALRKLDLRDANVFLPDDITHILTALEQENEAQFYREVKIKDRIFAEVLCLTPQFDSIRIYATDITDRKQAEEALQHSEEYFRLLMESASDVITILEGDGTIRYESLSVKQVLGYKPEELVGTSAFDLIHPDDLSDVTNIFSHGVKNPGIVLSAQFRCKHKDGSWRFLDVIGKNLLDNPTISGIVINARDITESKQAEEAVQSERQKLINILDSMVDGVYIVDQKYNIAYVNPEIEKEYGPVNGRSCHEYFEGQKEACTWCQNEEVFRGKTVRWEWYSDKTNKTYDLVNTPLKNPDGSVSKLGIFRDITERKQSEEKLRESEDRLRVSQQAAHVGTFDWNIETGVNVWTPELEAMYGLPPGSFAKTQPAWEQLIHPEDRAEALRQVERAFQTGQPIEGQWRVIWPDGSVHWLSGRWQVFKNQSGKPVRMSGINIDITKRKRAEDALRRSEERLQLQIDRMPIGCIVWDPEFRVVSWNRAAEEIFGFKAVEVLGKHPYGLIVPREAQTHVDTVWHRLLQGDTAAHSVNENITRDGRIIFCSWSNTPLTHTDGSVTGVLSMVEDITERKQAEEALQHSERRYRSFVDVTSQFAWVTDAAGQVLEDIPALRAFTGQTYEQAKGAGWADALHPEDMQRTLEAWNRAISTKTLYETEYRMRRHDGVYRLLLARGAPILNEQGNVVEWVGTCIDITERKQAEEALRESREDLDRAQAVGNIGSWRMDVQRNILTWSDENHRIFGLPKGTPMEYETFLSIVHPDDREYVDTKWKAGLVGENYDIEHRIVVDGNTKWVREKAYLEFDDAGRLLGGFGITQDITKRKHIEEELRRSRDELEIRVQKRTAELKKALERMSVTSKLLEFFVTKTTRKEYLDSAVDLLRDWTDCNCIGIRILDKLGNIPYESYKGFSMEFWEAENWISVKNHQCACIRVVLQKPEPQDVNMMTANGSFYCNNTETFASMLTEQELTRFRGLCIRTGFKSVAIVPILYKKAVLGALHIADKHEGMVPLEKIELIESVTPMIGEAIFRFSAEEALSESEERYRMLVDTMNEGLGMDDENGLLAYANDRLCEMLGYSRDEIIGRPVLSFFDEKNQKIIKEQIEKRNRGENEPYRIEWMGKDGQKIITLVSPKGIFDENGDYRGSFAVITDITEKLRLESIAEAVNTMENIGFIFSGIRHEIGNPVNSIKMALSVLKQNIDSYSIDKIKEYADRMLEEIFRMEYLLKAMKNFNMYETVELVDTNMTDFMCKFLSLVKGDFEKKGIKVEASVSEPAWVYADPRALQQVLLNILTNASDALEGQENPRITIDILKMADMVNIRVEDNGRGMTEEQQEDLFKPFYTTKSKGTGLGLVIAKKMITKMKGFIEVVSEKDTGTIVDLFIPEGISE